MQKMSAIAALLLLLLGCGDDGASPAELSLTDTYVGSYTTSLQPGVDYTGTLQLTHGGTSVSGTLTSTAGRSATIAGVLSGTRITGTMTFTDACPGSASTTVDVVSSGNKLVGNYSADDCLGRYTGAYNLDKQR